MNQVVYSCVIKTNPYLSSGFPLLTVLDGTLVADNNRDMEEDDRTIVHPCQWIQKDTHSAIIKLEPGATGKC